MAEEPAPLTSFDHRSLKPGSTAIFLDFDGTLADIVEHPDAVSVPLPTRKVLARLEKSTQGALAIVTGRSITDIDRFLAPLHLPIAGVHGLERRSAGGALNTSKIESETLIVLARRLQAFAEAHPGVVVETKPGSLALHYRQRPDLAEISAEAVHEAMEGLEGLHVLHGKMVREIKGGEATKADAIAAFMSEPPFQGRLPLFAGDDVTDEDAFHQIAHAGGISIKIGHAPTSAAFRTDDTASFRDWLAMLADNFDSSR